ncbi:MAG TPA: alpha/beta fold hydrolase [Terriglobales bacterium]
MRPPKPSYVDELQSRLIRIWEAMLGLQGIGVRDSFWDLGGTSFTAVRMLRRIEEDLGKSLPLATMLQVSTIEELANVLRGSGWQPAWSSLAAVQPSGSRPPFFLVHGISGMIIGFRHFAPHFRPDQPLYGLQALGIDGSRPALSRIEDMAAHYIAEIRRLQPQGPYYLAGICFGGWVAYEMAQQLSTAGEDVAFLGLLGTHRVHCTNRALARKLLRNPVKSIPQILRKSVVWTKEARENIGEFFLPRHLKRVRAGLNAAACAYRPRPYSSKITLFAAGRQSLRDCNDPASVWSDLAVGGLDVNTIDGDHNTMFVEPELSVLAHQLKRRLETAQQESVRQPAALSA